MITLMIPFVISSTSHLSPNRDNVVVVSGNILYCYRRRLTPSCFGTDRSSSFPVKIISQTSINTDLECRLTLLITLLIVCVACQNSDHHYQYNQRCRHSCGILSFFLFEPLTSVSLCYRLSICSQIFFKTSFTATINCISCSCYISDKNSTIKR